MRDSCVNTVLCTLFGVFVICIVVKFVLWLRDTDQFNQRITRMGCVHKQSKFAHIMARFRQRKHKRKSAKSAEFLSETKENMWKWSNFIHSATGDGFDRLTAGSGKSLLFVHADWCGACQMQKPEYNVAAEALVAKYVTPYEARADDLTPEQRASLNIQYFPMFVLFDGGKRVKDASGFMSVEELVSFVS
jgi:thiol-disulfide isomerase/thioredoxin